MLCQISKRLLHGIFNGLNLIAKEHLVVAPERVLVRVDTLDIAEGVDRLVTGRVGDFEFRCRSIKRNQALDECLLRRKC